jgi:hypothetical protein
MSCHPSALRSACVFIILFINKSYLKEVRLYEMLPRSEKLFHRYLLPHPCAHGMNLHLLHSHLTTTASSLGLHFQSAPFEPSPASRASRAAAHHRVHVGLTMPPRAGSLTNDEAAIH